MIFRWKRPIGSGNRTGWAKIVYEVDLDQPLGAKQFVGKYLLDGENEIDGEWILEYRPDGSVKHPIEHVAIGHIDAEDLVVWTVNPNEKPFTGGPSYVWHWRKDYFSFRKIVQKCLGEVELDAKALEEQIDQKRQELNDLILRYLAVKEGKTEELNHGLSLVDFSMEDVVALQSGVYMF
jgi:hypothetical protein